MMSRPLPISLVQRLRVFRDTAMPAMLLRTRVAALFFLALLPAAAQAPIPAPDLASGRLLVASRGLGDPNFAETVVLLVQYNNFGAMGLVLNRRTDVPISRVFAELPEAKGRPDPVFEGGPVERGGLRALYWSKTKIKGLVPVVRDVYLLSDMKLLRQILSKERGEQSLRVFAGYAGWGPKQLEREVEMGAWHIFRGDAATVFDSDPASLWNRMIERTGVRIARTPAVREDPR
ncbi:MAG: YqgE/AlgH family protein [Bryobacteraceae bacterium]|nr:YqgE/AlgH family protein [Bryobacteraceae bacterium]